MNREEAEAVAALIDASTIGVAITRYEGEYYGGEGFEKGIEAARDFIREELVEKLMNLEDECARSA